jgi:hypothetical protein
MYYAQLLSSFHGRISLGTLVLPEPAASLDRFKVLVCMYGAYIQVVADRLVLLFSCCGSHAAAPKTAPKDADLA